MRALEGESRVAIVVEAGCGNERLLIVATRTVLGPWILEGSTMGIAVTVTAGASLLIERKRGHTHGPAHQRGTSRVMAELGVARNAGQGTMCALERVRELVVSGHIDTGAMEAVEIVAGPATAGSGRPARPDRGD